MDNNHIMAIKPDDSLWGGDIITTDKLVMERLQMSLNPKKS